jgi:RecB family exonuclease
MFFGIVMHRAIHILHQVGELDGIDFSVIVDKCEDEVEEGYGGHPPQIVGWQNKEAEISAFIFDAVPILKVYWSKPYNHNAEIILSETEFAVDIGGFPFAGRIDELRRGPDGKTIINDYKTGKSAASEMLLEIGYQLSIYFYACEHGTFEGHGKIGIRPDFVGLYRTMDHLPYKKAGTKKGKAFVAGDERGPGLYLGTRTDADIDAMIQDLGIICRSIVGPRYDAKLKHLVKGGSFGRMPSYVFGQVACDTCSLKTECAAERRQAQGDTKEMENIITEEDFSHA